MRQKNAGYKVFEKRDLMAIIEVVQQSINPNEIEGQKVLRRMAGRLCCKPVDTSRGTVFTAERGGFVLDSSHIQRALGAEQQCLQSDLFVDERAKRVLGRFMNEFGFVNEA